jgi:hexulose-6-phosphate isomerase
MVIPLVDNGRLEDRHQEDALVSTLECHTKIFADLGLRVALESDYSPTHLVRLLDRLDQTVFGVNYDIGNSASLGHSPEEELAVYGAHILNVHVKDRLLGGGNVPLGEGAADFDSVFASLEKIGYGGNHILETARSAIGDHAGALSRFRDMTVVWISESRT